MMMPILLAGLRLCVNVALQSMRHVRHLVRLPGSQRVAASLSDGLLFLEKRHFPLCVEFRAAFLI